MPGPKTTARPLQFAFALTLDGFDDSTWKTVSGLEISMEVVDDPSVNSKAFREPARIPGQITYSDLTLTRGFGDMKLQDWFRAVIRDGKNEDTRNGSVTAYKADLMSEIARWNFTDAWPVSITASDMNVNQSERVIETMVLAVNELDRVK